MDMNGWLEALIEGSGPHLEDRLTAPFMEDIKTEEPFLLIYISLGLIVIWVKLLNDSFVICICHRWYGSVVMAKCICLLIHTVVIYDFRPSFKKVLKACIYFAIN